MPIRPWPADTWPRFLRLALRPARRKGSRRRQRSGGGRPHMLLLRSRDAPRRSALHTTAASAPRSTGAACGLCQRRPTCRDERCEDGAAWRCKGSVGTPDDAQKGHRHAWATPRRLHRRPARSRVVMVLPSTQLGSAPLERASQAWAGGHEGQGRPRPSMGHGSAPCLLGGEQGCLPANQRFPGLSGSVLNALQAPGARRPSGTAQLCEAALLHACARACSFLLTILSHELRL